MDATSFLRTFSDTSAGQFVAERRVLSFAEYLELVAKEPASMMRSSAQYLADAIQYFGHEERQVLGTRRRHYQLFDAAFDQGRDRLFGHESVQEAVVQALANLAREGKGNRLLLLHGPNGSAKTSFVQCLARAMVHYSRTPQGAVYTFNWIFPKSAFQSKQLGFVENKSAAKSVETYAHLAESEIGARVPVELRDHPLLLLPKAARHEFFAQLSGGPDLRLPRSLLDGDLAPVSKRIFDTLLVSYGGDLQRVLAHVQVERFHFSRRYRQGIVTVEPQMHVDAQARQVTMDENYAHLPPVLRHVSMFTLSGDLVDAHRGMVEYSDLLKRPLDAFKYLLGTCENSRVTVDGIILYLDTVFIGTSNDKYIAAFTKAPDFPSFKGRMELIRVPYLRDYRLEEKIYEAHVRPEVVGKHVAPHAIEVAAQWAVLTRLRRPAPESYPEALRPVLSKLTPVEKADLYALGLAPAEVRSDLARMLEQMIPDLASEHEDGLTYEGNSGASVREVRTALLNAAQSPREQCLHPVRVLEELKELTRQSALYEYLQQEPEGEYGDAEAALVAVEQRYIRTLDREFKEAMGLVTESEFERLLQRYALHASAWLKGDSIVDPSGKESGKADEGFLKGMEERWGRSGDGGLVRQEFLGRIAAYGLENPGTAVPYPRLFREQMELLARSYYAENRREMEKLLGAVLERLGGAEEGEQLEEVDQVLGELKRRFGYCDGCLAPALSSLAAYLQRV